MALSLRAATPSRCLGFQAAIGLRAAPQVPRALLHNITTPAYIEGAPQTKSALPFAAGGLFAVRALAVGRRRSRAVRQIFGLRAASGVAAPAKPLRLLLLDPLSRELLERLASLGAEVQCRGGGETVVEALLRVRPQAVVVRSSLLQIEELEQAASGCLELQLVMRAGAGVDNIAVEALGSRGVVVANAEGANAVAVAELTMAHLLNLDRRLSDQVESLRRGEWRRLEFAGALGLYGRTLAVLGVGHIGREVIKRARAFGMEVRAWSRSLTVEEATALGVLRCSSAEEAARGAHALSVHLPLAPSTQGLVGQKLLRELRPGALVVNMSRGGVVDEAALVAAVAERGLRAGLDVFVHEPGASASTFDDEAISGSAGIFCTHHTGARTEQAAEAVENAVLAAVSALLDGRRIPGKIV
ncbi:unnamed protein product [Polarella glacialis]|uniref:Phosphoglycerate dehydrogenase n=1 Tax=Polarella glacialis TaxID=89957 RepID=A0A813F9D4_POLGL|nr:unnamed protein product [Polarella glacialis]